MPPVKNNIKIMAYVNNPEGIPLASILEKISWKRVREDDGASFQIVPEEMKSSSGAIRFPGKKATAYADRFSDMLLISCTPKYSVPGVEETGWYLSPYYSISGRVLNVVHKAVYELTGDANKHRVTKSRIHAIEDDKAYELFKKK